MIPIEHELPVVSTRWSPDGLYLITASLDKTAKIWDFETGKILADLKGHQSELTDALFSPDGLLAATTSNDATAKLWDAKTGKLLFTLNDHISVVNEAFFTNDSRWLATRSSWDQSIKIWDTKTGKLSGDFKVEGNSPIRAFFNPEGNLLVAVYEHRFFRIYDWQNNKTEEVNYPANQVCDLADMSDDGNLLLTIDSSQTINVWDLPSGKWRAGYSPTQGQEIITACFSPDAQHILLGEADFTLMTIDPFNGNKQSEFLGHKGMIKSACYSPDGKTIVTTSLDNNAILWNAESGDSIYIIEGSFEGAQFDGFGELIAFSSMEYHPEIWTRSGDFFIDLIGEATPIAEERFGMDGSTLLVKSSFDQHYIWDLNRGRMVASIQTEGNETNTAELSPDGHLLAITNGKKWAGLWNAQTGKPITNLQNKLHNIIGTVFAPDGRKILTIAEDNSCQVWDIETEKKISSFPGADLSRSTLVFNPKGNQIALSENDYSISIVDVIEGQKTASLKGHQKHINTLDFSPDGQKLISTSLDGKAILWQVATGEKILSINNPAMVASDAVFSPNEQLVALMSDKGQVQVFNLSTGTENYSFPFEFGDQVFGIFSPDSKELFLLKKDSVISIHDGSTGKALREINLGYKSYFDDINFTKGQVLAGNNAESRLYSIETGKLLSSLFCFPQNDWAIVYPSGAFDASAGAMNILYWVKDMEVIELSQLKDGYYQPGIWEFAMKSENQPSVAEVDNLALQPDVELGELKNGILPITLTKRAGGYGKVVVFVNNKEVISDARPANFDKSLEKQSFDIDVSEFLYGGFDNEVTVKAESEDGTLRSRGFSKKVKRKVELTNSKPAFYAIICGTSDYQNPDLHLNYTVEDAKAMANALDIGASNLFGKDSVHLYVLTSPGATTTTKENIRKSFEVVSKRAKPEDIVLVYLSGHGIAVGGQGKGDFYYLTKDAKSKLAEDYKNAKERELVSISTEELTQWMNAIPAQKNIMVIDACGSGKAIDKMFASRGIETSQLKAIDRMMERTGIFIISGCAADEESFESNSLGQGLLTYSLLEGIKGAALKENIYIDILNIFDHAREEVPKMAREGGLSQEPQMFVPQKGSFDIGIINEADRKRIPLAKPKPVFVPAYLFESTLFDDTLSLSDSINNRLRDISENKTKGADIAFIEAVKYPGCCKITGGYSIESKLISFKGVVQCDQTKTPISFDKKPQDELINLIVDKALKASQKK